MGTTPRPNMTETSSANQGSFMGTRMSKPEQRSTQEAFLQGKNETPIQDEMMMSVKRLSSLEVVYKVGIFAAVVGTGKFLLPVLLSLENVSDKFIEKAQSWDWGTVLAALVGVCGYIIDSRNHRQAEIRQLHIDRAQNQMNSLLVPINIAFHGLLFGFYGFVNSHMDDFDLDEPVLGGNNPPPTKHQWSSSDKINSWVSWWTFNHVFSSPTGKFPVAIPYELPESLSEAVKDNPNSSLGAHYRQWIQHEWLPGVRDIAEIISQNGYLLEAIPVKDLELKFNQPPMSNGGNGNWHRTPRGMFMSMWLAYSRSWETVLAQWESGDFRMIRPTTGFPCGLYFFIVTGQDIVGTLQKELTGQSQMHGSRGIKLR